MKYLFTFAFLFVFTLSPVFAQELQVLDVVDDQSGELTLNLSRLTTDLSSYELIIDGVSHGEFSGDQSSVTISMPSLGEHLVDIIVTSRFTGAQGQVSFILNIIPPEEFEFIIPVPQFIQNGARMIIQNIPGKENTIDATNVVSATAVATSSTLSGLSLFTSFADIINYLVHVFFSILEFFGIRKRAKPWGTVYNSITKQPLSFAKVKLLDEHSRVLETKIADKQGRFGFLVTPESVTAEGMSIQFQAEKKGFGFPSEKVAPPKDTVLYEHVYTGGVIKIQTAEAANFDLPMDPSKITAKQAAKIPSIRFHNTFTRIADAGFWVALVTTPLSFLADPNIYSFSLMILFFTLAFFRIFGLKEQPFGVVVDDTANRPMAFALITLNDKQGIRKGFTVSDEEGRYFLVTEKGNFDLNIFTPADVQPQRSIKEEISAKKGWIAEEIHI